MTGLSARRVANYPCDATTDFGPASKILQRRGKSFHVSATSCSPPRPDRATLIHFRRASLPPTGHFARSHIRRPRDVFAPRNESMAPLLITSSRISVRSIMKGSPRILSTAGEDTAGDPIT
jgi:hypothetical protein